jgi:hypothetical protein
MLGLIEIYKNNIVMISYEWNVMMVQDYVSW